MKYIALIASAVVVWMLMRHDLDNVLRMITLTIVVTYLLLAKNHGRKPTASLPRERPRPVRTPAPKSTRPRKKRHVTGPLSAPDGIGVIAPSMIDPLRPCGNYAATDTYFDLYGGRGMFM